MMTMGSFATYALHFSGLLIVLIGLSLKPRMKKTGIAIAIAGFLMGTAPVWYSAMFEPSEEEFQQMQYERWLEHQRRENPERFEAYQQPDTDD